MTVSKRYKKPYVYLTILLATFVLAGCVKADRKSKEVSDIDESAMGRGQIISTGLLDESLSGLNNAAQFRSSDISLKTKATFDGSSHWRQANQLQMQLQVCGIADMRSGGNLNGQKFRIKSELGNPVDAIAEVASDCLNWSYIVPVNLVAPSVNLAIHFEIKSINGLGKIVKRLGFNPWDILRNKTINEKYFDLTNHSRKAWGSGFWVYGTDKIISALKGDLIENKAKLNVTNLSVHPVEKSSKSNSASARYEEMLAALSSEERKRRLLIDKEMRAEQGVFVNLNLSANPVVELKDSSGVDYNMPIGTGRFRVYMNLLAHNTATGKKHIINQYVPAMAKNGGSAFTWMADQTNGIQASIPMVLKARSTFGEIELVVKIEPVDLKNVKPFTAVYNLGQYNQWARKQTPAFQKTAYQPLSEVEFMKYIKSADNFKEYEKKFTEGLGAGADKSLAAQQLFYFDQFNIRFMRIMPGETATDRTFQYSVQSCINHGVFGYRVGPGLQFEVTTENKKKKSTFIRQTRDNGCLTWFGFVSHKYYHKEVFEEKTADVRFVGTERVKVAHDGSEEGKAGAKKEEAASRQRQWDKLINKYERRFTYFMNPWDEKFTFGWEGENLPENYAKKIEEQRKSAPETKLFIHEFRYETMGFRYEIDKYMNLKVKKTVLLKMYPVVLKYNSIVYGRRGTEPLRDGIYLMKVALQKDYLDPAARGLVIKDRTTDDRVSQPVATKDGRTVNDKLIDQDDILRQDKKQQITVQTKLIRVLGGIIITPIEFEIEDLRLMRIRNQFFVQLQTIDEGKLRLATFLDGKLTPEGIEEKRVRDEQYETLFKKMDQLKDIDQKISDARHKDALAVEKAVELKALMGDLNRVGIELDAMLGLNPRDPDYKEKKALLKKRFEDLDEYRAKGVNGQTAARNDKWRTINRLLKAYGNKTEKLLSQRYDQVDEENKIESDHFQKYFFSPKEVTSQSIKSILGSESDRDELDNFLKNTDFTTGTLAPNFPLEILANDGLNPEDSGLPSRTFVGPLTFLLNTNGSPLRPTDILEETKCLTATCGAVEIINGRQIPVPGVKGFGASAKDGQIVDEPNPPVLGLGDSVNASYENNEYYGYLKKYGTGGSGENNGWTVDDLIEKREILKKKKAKLLKTSSQIINFVSALGLKYVNLSDNPESDLKDIDVDCVKAQDWESVDQCFVETERSRSKQIGNKDLLGLLNGDVARYPYWKPEPGERSWLGKLLLEPNRSAGLLPFYKYFKKEDDVEKKDLINLMKYGWKDSRLDKNRTKTMYHRFCYALSQQLLSKDYLKRENKYWSKKNNWSFVRGLEKRCHDHVENVYGKPLEGEDKSFGPPIIFERKVKVLDTTKRYVYRGGKSLNINTGASFSLSHNKGFGRNRSVNVKPTDILKDAAGYVSGVAKTIIGALGFTVTYNDSDSISESDGTTVSSATFLVSQSATFDIELGKYERCLVARLSPHLIKMFLRSEDVKKDNFDEQKDLETLGLMICSGTPKKDCLPVKEKYYYFTQHFTEGDMLDTGDLHNHPWLLQLRGYRDFQAFVSMIGARKHRYTEKSMVGKYMTKVGSDMSAIGASIKGRNTDNQKLELEVINKKEEPDWPLTALGEAYFNVLPTFPGLYTYVEDDEHQVKDWPERNPDPNQAFKCKPAENAKRDSGHF